MRGNVHSIFPLAPALSPKMGARGKINCAFINDFPTAFQDTLPLSLLTLRKCHGRRGRLIFRLKSTTAPLLRSQ
jgi:hypothetical protein